METFLAWIGAIWIVCILVVFTAAAVIAHLNRR